MTRIVKKPVTLQDCLDGNSDYCHADKIKELYEHLELLGNNTEWQIFILHVLTEGVLKKHREFTNIPWPTKED